MKFKYIILALFMWCYSYGMNAQCVQGVVTDPYAPKNDQFTYHLPINPFLNKFDWMYIDPLYPGNFKDILINPLAGFAPGFSNTFIAPYSDQNPSEYGYLHPNASLELRDGYSPRSFPYAQM